MAKRILCIEVGLRYTRISEMMGYKAVPAVYNCITFPTPQGTFEDGYIRDKGTLGSVIRQQLVENRIKTTEVVFTVNSTKIANREVLIPYVAENRIKSIVELQASDYFPVDISDYNISYYILGKGDKKDKERKIKLLLLAAPNNLIQSYYNLASAAGLQIEAIDYIGNSFYQIAKRQLNQGVNISVHINENTSLVNIIENENLLLQRIIPYGANELIEKVVNSSVFQADSDEAAISLLQKEKLINFQFEPQKDDGITYRSASEEYDRVKKELKAKEEVTESLHFLINNIIRVLDYFTAKNPEKKIGFAYVSGLGSKFQGLAQLFKNELGFDTKKIENIYVANFSNKINISQAQQADYIACIGAGIAPVNFGVKQRSALGIKKTDVKSWKSACVFMCVICFVFIGTMAFLKVQAETQKNRMKKDIKDLEQVKIIYDTYKETEGKYKNVNKMHEMTLSKVDKLDIILRDFEQRLPKKMSVTSLTIDQDTLELDGETTTPLVIAKLLINLEDIPYLTDFNVDSFKSTSSEGSSGISTVSFKITGRFNGTEVGAELDKGDKENSSDSDASESESE